MKYKLLKDTPNDTAGSLVEYDNTDEDSDTGFTEFYVSQSGLKYPIKTVENNPEWFEPIE